MDSIYLRALDSTDLERTYKWHNDQELYRSLGGQFRYVSHASEEEWLHQKVVFSHREVNLAICLTSTSQHIGNIYIRDIDWVARNGHFTGLLIGEPDQRSKGYGQAALRLLINHAFQDLGLVRLWGFLLEENKPSFRMLEKCGFVVEGKLRNHAFKDGHFKDVLIVGLCASDIKSGVA